MPQIGWFEILIVVVLSIVIIGPKDFPIVLKKIGTWVGSLRSYFKDFQKSINEVEDSFEEDLSIDKDLPKVKKLEKEKND